jgi:transcriptional regulator GlxA family with amidase domain
MEQRLFVIDRDRYTCAGGTAPLDMMHAIIARDHGAAFANRISDWFIQTEVRLADAPQQPMVKGQYGPLPAPVRAALDLMETHVADPLGVEQIAGLVAISPRQLQRLFRDALGRPAGEVYRNLRLDIARDLLHRSTLKVNDVAHMTGFSGLPHFSTAFRERFGHSPRAERQAAQTKNEGR